MIPFLASTSLDDLKTYCKEHGFPAFRASQIDSWLHTHCIVEPEMMKNLPNDLKAALKKDFFAPGSQIAEVSTSADKVEKLLLKLHDGEFIEMVVIPTPQRLTFCLSTQVGCPVGCYFCASGRNGLTRNLTAGEMLEEFCIGTTHAGRPDNLVFMGITIYPPLICGFAILTESYVFVNTNSIFFEFFFYILGERCCEGVCLLSNWMSNRNL